AGRLFAGPARLCSHLDQPDQHRVRARRTAGPPVRSRAGHLISTGHLTGAGHRNGRVIAGVRPGEATMAKTSMAAIVCSLHGRTGKTLLARVIAEYTLMSEERPLIFDTNAVDCSLEACFPGRSRPRWCRR